MLRIVNEVNRRSENKYIILTQAMSTYENFGYLSNDALLGGSYKYTWGEWQKYYIQTAHHRKLPCHYYMEFLDDDYVIYVGNPLCNKSYFLEDLARNEIINQNYANAILVVLSEDFRYVQTDKEMLYHLCDKLVSSLMVQFPISDSAVLTLDDILKNEWKENLENSGLKYNIQPMSKFNKNELLRMIRQYRKGWRRTELGSLAFK